MAILIDGYNLLNATGVEGTGRGTELERARRGLLLYLSDTLTSEECATTTIVFDSQGAPPGLPNQESFRGITVLFAKGYSEADELLEELIAADHVPRQLLVVSSDHRLHRAARRRRAVAIDSEVWISQLDGRDNRTTRRAKDISSDMTPCDAWLAEFSDVDVTAIAREIAQEDAAGPPKRPEQSPPRSDGQAGSHDVERPASQPKPSPYENPFPEDFGAELDDESWGDLANPFPPGFGDDLCDD